jgi:bifunctional UDP-N-acetylglucosamine pyrophosphorylase/glucosamine-1-phosphate N-acetyltransferase
MGEEYIYAYQTEQLGTGHAVSVAEPVLKNNCDAVMVFPGDMPFISPQTISGLAKTHEETGADLTMGVVIAPDFEGPHKFLYDFGRIVRDQEGNLVKIVEVRDAAPEEREIKEVNPSFYCFNAAWLWEALPEIKNENVQGEYYLTDVLEKAVLEKKKISVVEIGYAEAMGINTPEQLAAAEEMIQ